MDSPIQIKAGSTSNMIDFPIYDSSSTTGARLTGLAYNTASLVAYYQLATAASATAITLATATSGTYTSSGFVVKDATNMTGVYQLGIPDAAVASAGRLTIDLRGAANMVPKTITIDVVANTAFDIYDSLITGNIPVGAIPALGIVDNGTAQSATSSTLVMRSAAGFADSELVGATVQVVSATTGAGQSTLVTANVGSTDTLSVTWPATTPTGTIKYVVFGTPQSASDLPVAANVTQIGGVTQSATDLKDFADTGYDPATHKVQGVVLSDTVTTYTGNTPQTGDAYARLGAPAGASTAADIAALLTTAMTESYAADGAAMTAAQALYLIAQTVGEFSVSGTTLTVKKLDGTTTAATYTLDSSSAPTSRTRAT